MRSAKLLAAALPLLSGADDDVYCGDWKIEWFHLQDESGSWNGHMQDLTKQITSLANSIEGSFPGSRMGLGAYQDKAQDHEDFVLITDFTDKDSALNALLTRFPATWNPNLPAGLSPWPDDDSSTPDSDYAVRTGKHNDEPEGTLEPIIWATLHASWKDGEGIFRFMTEAIAGLGHYQGDTSMEEQAAAGFADFDRDTYPAGTSAWWPSDNVKLGTQTKYASLELTKAVIEEADVHLVILYGVDGNEETPRKGWQNLLTKLGIDYTTALFYMPMNLNIEASVLSGLRSATCDATEPPTTEPTTTTTSTTTTAMDVIECCRDYCPA